MKFRDLAVGQTFDWIDDETPRFNSFFPRCIKLSARRYRTADGSGGDYIYHVGTINAAVFHVN